MNGTKITRTHKTLTEPELAIIKGYLDKHSSNPKVAEITGFSPGYISMLRNNKVPKIKHINYQRLMDVIDAEEAEFEAEIAKRVAAENQAETLFDLDPVDDFDDELKAMAGIDRALKELSKPQRIRILDYMEKKYLS